MTLTVDGKYVMSPPRQPPVGEGFAAMVADHTRDIIIVTNPREEIVWVNAAFERCTGYRRAEVLHRRPRDFLQGPGTSPIARAQLASAVRSGEAVRKEILNYRRSGEPFWLDLQVTPVYERGELTHFVAIERDITEQKQLTATLSAFHQALNQQAIVSIADRTGRISFVNDHFCAISGYSREELMGRDHRIVNSGWHSKGFFRDVWRTIGQGRTWHGEICNRRKTGDLYWVDTTIVPVMDSDGKAESYVSIRFDITQRKRVEELARRLAEQDDLTGLSNRHALLRELDECLRAQALQEDEAGALLLVVDVREFRNLNESLGHQAGDRVLAAIGRRLERLSHRGDLVARLGGNEFCLVMRHVDEAAQQPLIDRVERTLSEPFVLGAAPLSLTFAIGAATFPQDAGDAPGLLRAASLAMRHARQTDTATVRFTRELQERIDSALEMQHALRTAIANDGLHIVFQPQIRLDDGSLRGFEVLVRWERDGVPVAPSEFVPAAERCGLILPLGSLVIAQALDACALLRKAGLDPGLISINVSPEQLSLPGFAAEIVDAARLRGIAPDSLELEITETAFVSPSAPHVELTVQALRAHGFSLALDDFGTGYSSLTHLKRFRVDVIKIDREFIDDGEIVQAIIGLAGSLGMEVVAEGVETPAQADRLVALGCGIGQGFYYGRPLSLDGVIRLLRSGAGFATSALPSAPRSQAR